MTPSRNTLEAEQRFLRHNLALMRSQINRAVRRPLTRSNARRTADLIRGADDLTNRLRTLQEVLSGDALEPENTHEEASCQPL